MKNALSVRSMSPFVSRLSGTVAGKPSIGSVRRGSAGQALAEGQKLYLYQE
jgi:hypothetical protein